MRSLRLPPLVKGILVSAVVTGCFYALVKILANTVIPRFEQAYLQERGFESEGSGMTEWANLVADSLPGEWLLLFAVFWIPIGLLGTAPRHVSLASIAILAIALGLSLYLALNAMFDWYSWSCFEAPGTHVGFQLARALECPSREVSYAILLWGAVCLAFAAGILGAVHTRKMGRDKI